MDSNSTSYLVLMASALLPFILLLFLSRAKNKSSYVSKDSNDENNDQLKQGTGHFVQSFQFKSATVQLICLMVLVPIFLVLPILIFKSNSITAYFILLFVMTAVFMAWFYSINQVLNGEDENNDV
jgi:hypothetical protein